MYKIIIILLLPILLISEEIDVSKYLSMVAEGRTDEVRSLMLDLYITNPNDPGVMLLTGAVLQDAFKAMDFYNKIMLEHPQSQWADDATWRIIQFYAVMGDAGKANVYLQKMRQMYPTSEFLVPATDIVRTAVGLAKYKDERSAMLPDLDLAMSKEPESDSGKDEVVEEKPKQVENAAAKPIIKPKEEKKEVKKVEPEKKPEQKPEQVVAKPEPKKENVDIASKIIAEEQMNAVKQAKESNEVKNQGYYGLQVAATDLKEDAEKIMQKYLSQRMRTEIISKNSASGAKYLVIIGNYSEKESAEAAKIIVSRQCGCNPEVIQK